MLFFRAISVSSFYPLLHLQIDQPSDASSQPAHWPLHAAQATRHIQVEWPHVAQWLLQASLNPATSVWQKAQLFAGWQTFDPYQSELSKGYRSLSESLDGRPLQTCRQSQLLARERCIQHVCILTRRAPSTVNTQSIVHTCSAIFWAFCPPGKLAIAELAACKACTPRPYTPGGGCACDLNWMISSFNHSMSKWLWQARRVCTMTHCCGLRLNEHFTYNEPHKYASLTLKHAIYTTTEYYGSPCHAYMADGWNPSFFKLLQA